MWQTYLQPTSLAEALHLVSHYSDQARIVAGGTDVLVELQRGIKPTSTLIDISAIADLKYIRSENGNITLGALATHNDVIRSEACMQYALPLAQACWEVGAPQIRTRATVTGNVVTASPANDTIVPLMALNAAVVLTSSDTERVIPLRDFYTGVRRTVLKAGELLREIRIPALTAKQRGLFLKLGLRQAQAISVINAAFVLTFDGDVIADASITLGCLAPTVVHARSVEAYLKGKRLNQALCQEAGRLALNDVSPIDDIRASAVYRQRTLASFVAYGLQKIAAGTEQEGRVIHPVTLDTSSTERRMDSVPPQFNGMIETTINGQPRRFHGAQRKTLLNALREDAGLSGTKEGCAEGECGACTVWLDGQAVMSCLVPAAQAHGAEVTTIEGLADGEELHPLQKAFIEQGAVQCGFCIPGMLMAGAKLLDEHPRPTPEQTRVALSGNICRCTGYRKILDAVAQAGEQGGQA